MNTLRLAALILGLLLALRGARGAGADAQTLAAARPNLVFLLSDDQRWDTLGCLGNPVIRTPHLDGLAREGVLFPNAFVTTSVCGPSRTSIMAGNYARSRGVGQLARIMTLDRPDESLPAVLRRGGYETGYIGKWGIGGLGEFQQGAELFDFWAADRHHGNYWHGAECPYVTNDGRAAKVEIRCECPPKGSLPRVGHEGIDRPLHFERDLVPVKVGRFLAGRDLGKPFLLCVAFRSPKDPWADYPESVARLYEGEPMPIPRTATREAAARKPAFLRRSLASDHGRRMAENHDALAAELRKYYRQITTMDAAVGEIRRLLAEAGLAGNTVIFFTADNGYYLGDHGLWGKWTPYEASIRVPLLVFDPRVPRVRRGATRPEMVLNIDLAPTMLALAECPIPGRMQGMDFSPLLLGEQPAWRRDWFYEHMWNAEGRIEPSEAVRTVDWKYIRFPAQTPVVEQLFHLTEDPDELYDLSADPAHARRLETMRVRMAAYQRDLAGGGR